MIGGIGDIEDLIMAFMRTFNIQFRSIIIASGVWQFITGRKFIGRLSTGAASYVIFVEVVSKVVTSPGVANVTFKALLAVPGLELDVDEQFVRQITNANLLAYHNWIYLIGAT